MGLLKKAASRVLASFPDLRAHRLDPLRAVSARVLPVRPHVKLAVALLDGRFEPTRGL